MKVTLASEKQLSGVKRETGKSFDEWFALLDKQVGADKGRREIGMYLGNTVKVDPWWGGTITVEYENARGAKEKDGRPRGYSICATKKLKASPDACFAAWATPGALDTWLGAKHEGKVEDGARLTNADGNVAEIKKINKGKTIRLTWQDPLAAPGTPVEVKFQASGPKTTVMVVHERLQTREEADGLRAAWGEALDRLKAVVEKG
ncbi:MAG: SRPBCC domain-containing protein [Acidobacteria bacterium]|nr:SRPBCC domain-containing protein [Acidobacteriota bacterium]